MVEPRLSRGLRDLLPDTMLARQRMIDTIRGVYELYGFSPLDTPAIEYLDVLSGSAGEDAQQQIFQVTNPEGEALGLRFDLTVPLSRVVSQYPDMVFPFRRYQVSSVWRADKPEPGRYRQFTQFDLDSVGAESDVADTEILAAMCDTLDALKVGPYIVRFSSRRILNLVLDYAGIAHDGGPAVFRILDKLDKIGLDKVKLELTTGYRDESGAPIAGLGLSSDQVEKIERFLGIKGASRGEVLKQLRALFANVENAQEEIDVIERISSHLESLGYGSDRVAVDLTIARGLAYYTGPVFEANLLDAPQFGSVFAGGRYDDLVKRFTGRSIPATGASIGVDRLLAALIELGRIEQPKTTSQVLVTAMDGGLMSEYLAITYELRRAGIRTEIHVGAPKRLGKQIQRADRLDIPYVVIMGSDEAQRGVVTVKEMIVGREKAADVGSHEEWKAGRFGQQEIARTDLVKTLRQLLGQ
ncbi:MAG: histidine--tRNA ligase [Acidobacteria bacterium]|nr:histidine--tRNA ligase [Acidobacteriota bacterium]